jgi:hypothetical protein
MSIKQFVKFIETSYPSNSISNETIVIIANFIIYEPEYVKFDNYVTQFFFCCDERGDIINTLTSQFEEDLDFQYKDNCYYVTQECLSSLLLVRHQYAKRKEYLTVLSYYKVFRKEIDKCEKFRDEANVLTLCKQINQLRDQISKLNTKINDAIVPGYIYRIENTLTNEFYIGSSYPPPENRLLRHIQTSEKDSETSKLYENIRLHGEKNFRVVTVKQLECLKDKVLEREEAFHINRAYLENPDKCLNTKSLGILFKCKDCGKEFKTDPHRPNSTHKCKQKKEIPTESA